MSSSSLLYVLPREEILKRDRSSLRSPRLWLGDRVSENVSTFHSFDDTKAVSYEQHATMSMPTTLYSGSVHLSSLFTTSLSTEGRTSKLASEQWLFREEPNVARPFVEASLFEQEDIGKSIAYDMLPDAFEPSLRNKSTFRIEFPLTTETQLEASASAMHYLNPSLGKFDLVVTESFNMNPYKSVYPDAVLAPILFTPYGHHFVPANNFIQSKNYVMVHGYTPENYSIERTYEAVSTFSSLNKELYSFFAVGLYGESTTYLNLSAFMNSTFTATHSLENRNHDATNDQTISLSWLNAPFLVEKIVVEFPFKADASWMEDRFEMTTSKLDFDGWVNDASGPMITCALLRQKSAGPKNRELIASASFTNSTDFATGSYKQSNLVLGGVTSSYRTMHGVRRLSYPNLVLDSAANSGNFDGQVKLTMEPAVTTHVWRMNSSGTTMSGTSNYADYVGTQPKGLAWSTNTRTSNTSFESARSVLGSHVSSLDPKIIKGRVEKFDDIAENYLDTSTVKNVTVYSDVVSTTKKSPYLIEPGDKLVLCLNKHRSVGTGWATGSSIIPAAQLTSVSRSHAVSIPTGSVKLTLYGDFLQKDKEYKKQTHQTLDNLQINETIGEEPILDQFDVSLRTEFSGSFIDRCNIFSMAPYFREYASGSYALPVSYDKDPGNFNNETDSLAWSAIGIYSNTELLPGIRTRWAEKRRAHELKKSSRNFVLKSDNEVMWDTRLPDVKEVSQVCNISASLVSGFGIYNTFVYALVAGTTSSLSSSLGASLALSGSGPAVLPTTEDRPNGIGDWFMTYPYESKYSECSSKLFKDVNSIMWDFCHDFPLAGGIVRQKTVTDIRSLSLEIDKQFYTDYTYFKPTPESPVTQSYSLPKHEFVKAFYGIGDRYSAIANQAVGFRTSSLTNMYGPEVVSCIEQRGWRYGMENGFETCPIATFRRDRFGQPRDMLEQRMYTKYYDTKQNVLVVSPVQVKFVDRKGMLTDPLKTLSSNMSSEATSSVPYCDNVSRNRPALVRSDLNILNV